MAAKKEKKQAEAGGTIVQLNLFGLVIFSVALILAAGGLTFFLTRGHGPAVGERNGSGLSAAARAGGNPVTPGPHETPAWGDLLEFDIELEKPEEYVAFEAATNGVPQWVFPQQSLEAVRTLLAASGLTSNELTGALAPANVSVTPTGIIVKPDEATILGLSPATRANLYNRLAEFPGNHYIKNPFVFADKSFDTIAAEGKLDKNTCELVRKLLFPRGTAECFADLEFVLQKLPGEKERIAMMKAFSRQSATLVRLQITPDTDIDKLLGYWAAPANGVRLKDVRPLLESLQRLPGGSSISLLYLLPQFARQRLYTFPMPAAVGDPMMDCHWSTLNFFNETPDNRFNDPAYTQKYIDDHYYQIGQANAYGDVIFLLDAKNTVIHSGVYLAGDLVFTKNGRSTVQPWIIMHLKDLLGIYASSPGVHTIFYRNKSN